VLASKPRAICRVAERLGVSVRSGGGLLAAEQRRVIVSGVGKSRLIARKIAATFTSTELPPRFSTGGFAARDWGSLAATTSRSCCRRAARRTSCSASVNQLKRLGVPIIG